jgi:hypothetical protein
MNNGDGTFRGATTYKNAGSGPTVATDVTVDRLPDLVVSVPGGINVLANKGDGSFSAPVFYASGTGLNPPDSIVAGDLFHDGHQDIAIVEVANFGMSPALTVFSERRGSYRCRCVR